MITHRPIVIGHRGAPGHRLEHTLASYELAARLFADFLEPDLVATADGVLVARHEPELSATTDIATRPEFADRHTTRVVDGRERTGWFVDDLTLAEVRRLRATERLPALRPANTRFDGLLGVPTFTEVLHLRARLSAELGRAIGIYPETKNPRYFGHRGVPLEPALVAALREVGPCTPVFVQSFDPGSLRLLRRSLAVPLVQLVDDDRPDLVTPASLARIADYADAVGVHKGLVIPRTATGTLGRPTAVVADAHAVGLAVHAFTFRDENAFLPADLRRRGGGTGVHGADRAREPTRRSGSVDAERGDGRAECVAFLHAGVDGLFADHPETAVAARDVTRSAGPRSTSATARPVRTSA